MDDEQNYYMVDRLADVRPSPEGKFIRLEFHGRFMQLVMEISPSLHRAIELCDLGGLRARDTANILGVSQGTVKAQVFRARTMLKQIMCGT